MQHTLWLKLASIILLLSLISGCGSANSGQAARIETSQTSPPQPAVATQTAARSTASAVPATPTPAPPFIVNLWVSPKLPERLSQALQLPAAIHLTKERAAANLRLEAIIDSASLNDKVAEATWIYALVVPFPTPLDEVNGEDIRQVWQGKASVPFDRKPLLMSPETYQVLQTVWGDAKAGAVQEVPADQLLDMAWQENSGWAIVPFEAIEPRWKVLGVDGQSPLEKTFDAARYPLAVSFALQGQMEAQQAFEQMTASERWSLPTNRDPNKLTVLVMTGVTALSRQTAETMEREGVTYPAQDIREWLVNADLTHISNEVSFNPECPPPGPGRRDMRFCSNPAYIGLLEDVGTDIVELTGNHILDWGTKPFLDTLAMYQARGWKMFGGGKDLQDSLQPLYVTHNGNRLVFLGCSPAGPESVWATKDKPGSAPCDLEKMENDIRQLRDAGYLPVVTFQGIETDGYKPAVAQRLPDFRRMAQAGAVIVSGSQSHYPQTMTFTDENFVHYGLGNLFFDQMDLLETRQEFIDRHVFYDGHYLGVELLTALLEDYARPRPMTPTERETFLTAIFDLSNWDGN